MAPVLAVGSVSDTLQVILGGIATGGLYAVLLLGVILVFQVSKNVNFAYGEVGVIGAMVSYVAYSAAHLPVPAALRIAFSSNTSSGPNGVFTTR